MRNQKLKLSGIALAGIIVLVSFVYAINIQPVVIGDPNWIDSFNGLRNFESYKELTDFLRSGSGYHFSYYPWRSVEFELLDISSVDATNSGGKVVDYSNTNVQVTGVDEPDIVKTDGKYLYIVSGNRILIVKATPAEDAAIECEIKINESFSILNIFISGSRLVVFVQDYNYPIYDPLIFNSEVKIETTMPPHWYSSPDTHILIYELDDMENPELVKDVSVPGTFTGARLIDDFVYLVTVQYSWEIYFLNENETIVPKITINDEIKEIPLSDISYVGIPEAGKTLTNIVSINVHDDTQDVTVKIFILGNSQVLYVTKNNIYVTYSTYNYNFDSLQKILEEILIPILPESIKSEIEIVKTLSLEDYQKQTVIEWLLQNYTSSMSEEEKNSTAREINRRIEKTVIHRISIGDGKIEYAAQGEIPGQVSNQFSLSEYNGYLRISSILEGNIASGYFSGSQLQPQNNIYVLDMDLKIVGSVEGLAPGERIYATRFIEDKCYLVTFRQVDPFFVIDLSDPTSPKVLGELKIPGYSTYLHPYDDEHIIGIGMDGDKVKISLFDVTDMSNPIELSKYEISNEYGWGSSSALYEHKAFLFDKEKNLLVVPVWVNTKESAYVFNISIEDGIELRGIISHDSVKEEQQEDYYNYDYGYSIKRTLYIDNVLYTISDNMVKMNSLDDLSEINSVILV